MAGFGAAWDRLVELAPLPSPFLRSWWLEHAGNATPLYVLVTDGNRLLGGLALDEDRVLGVQRLRLRGAGPLAPDHLDLVALPDRTDDVVAALARWLRRPGSRLLDLEGLAEGNRLRAALPGPVVELAGEIAPYTLLPADPAEYLARRPSRLRNTLRRTQRKLAAEYRRAGPAEVDRALADLRRLHAERWPAGSGFLAEFAAFAAAARTGARRGEVVFHELVADGEVVACEVTFEIAGRSSFYQGGRSMADRWRGAGTVLRAAVLDRACREGFSEHDLLRGDEGYKREWAEASRPLVHLRAARGISGRALLLLLQAREAARHHRRQRDLS